METTKLIFEFLAGGILFSLSLAALGLSAFQVTWQKGMEYTIYYRFTRYVRSIERSYLALIHDQVEIQRKKRAAFSFSE